MPMWFIFLFVAAFGAVIGSFLNVVALRANQRATILSGRSECPSCKHVLRWYELVPLLSFAIQGARCRSCKKRLSWVYPAGELSAAALALFSFWYGFLLQSSWVLAAGIFIAGAAFLVMSITDFRTMEIQPEYCIVAAIAAGAANILSGYLSWQSVLLGIVAGAGSILFLSIFWRVVAGQYGMGEGDAWITGAVGALVGWPLVLPALFFAVITGSVVGVIWAAVQGRGLAIRMPFGPFLALGGFMALVWGQWLLSWYIL
jgi:leader peptidase (prepilin peptidase) / N-methyltransferase